MDFRVIKNILQIKTTWKVFILLRIYVFVTNKTQSILIELKLSHMY